MRNKFLHVAAYNIGGIYILYVMRVYNTGDREMADN